MTLNEIKKMPWFGISAVALQGLAFGLGFVAMIPGLQIGLIMGLLVIGTATIAVEHFKDRSKFKERDSHHLVGIMLTLSAAVLIGALVSSLVFGMSMITVPTALGITLISSLIVGCRIEMRMRDNKYRKLFDDSEDSEEDELTSKRSVTDFNNKQPTRVLAGYNSDEESVGSSERQTLVDRKLARLGGW